MDAYPNGSLIPAPATVELGFTPRPKKPKHNNEHELLARRHQRPEKKPRRPRRILHREQRATTLGVDTRNSLWKYKWEGAVYIVQVTTGKVSPNGNIEIEWKGYRSSKKLVQAQELEIPSDQDFDDFERGLQAARKSFRFSHRRASK